MVAGESALAIVQLKQVLEHDSEEALVRRHKFGAGERNRQPARRWQNTISGASSGQPQIRNERLGSTDLDFGKRRVMGIQQIVGFSGDDHTRHGQDGARSAPDPIGAYGLQMFPRRWIAPVGRQLLGNKPFDLEIRWHGCRDRDVSGAQRLILN